MALSRASIFVLTFLVAFVLVILIRKNRNWEQDVVVYFIGYREFEEQGNDEQHAISGQLHVAQLIKQPDDDGNLTVVNII